MHLARRSPTRPPICFPSLGIAFSALSPLWRKWCAVPSRWLWTRRGEAEAVGEAEEVLWGRVLHRQTLQEAGCGQELCLHVAPQVTLEVTKLLMR